MQKAEGDCPSRVHSDQMVLVMAGGEAGPHEKWPKMLKGKMENNYRKPRELVKTGIVGENLRKGSTYSFSG